jgi:RimJ/RimL family protein N-acetyltransferase
MVELPTISTSRLLLRPPRLADFARLEPMLTSERARYTGGPYSRRHAWFLFCHEIAHWHLFGHGGLALELVATGQCVGTVCVNHGPLFPEKQLSWLLCNGCEGRGYATEAARALRDWAMGAGGLSRLVSYVEPANIASIAVARRLGAVLEETVTRRDAESLVYRHVRSDGASEASYGRVAAAPMPRLATPRLVLRPLRLEDFPLMAQTLYSERARYMGGPHGTQAAWGLFCDSIAQWHLFGHGGLAVELAATGQCVGLVTINHGPLYPEKQLGWMVFEGCEGQGYATEAAQALRHWAFAEGGITRLVSYMSPDDMASIGVARRLGALVDDAAPRPDPAVLVYRHLHARSGRAEPVFRQ